MLNVLEDRTMMNPINDLAKLKPIDADNRMKTKQQDNKSMTESLEADSVSLSNTSKQLEALKASLKDIPEINEARVLYFKTELAMGNYQINSDAIARNMLNAEMA